MRRPPASSRIPWAATSVTILGLGFALTAAGLAVGGRMAEAFVLLMAAGLADLFDGWVARRTDTGGGTMGIQLDSLVDMASFGVVPLILVFASGDGPPDAGPAPLNLAIGWIYASCAALRLARFNADAGSEPGPLRRYRGLPVTYAALVFPVAFAVGESVPGLGTEALLSAAALAQAALFVSPVPVPKPRGLAYPFFLVLATAVAAYLLLHVGTGGSP